MRRNRPFSTSFGNQQHGHGCFSGGWQARHQMHKRCVCVGQHKRGTAFAGPGMERHNTAQGRGLFFVFLNTQKRSPAALTNTSIF
jgi:hypothetical protein